ncbi:uncharacterized protein RJT21DRAFT_14374 [Scheffersomyces amazonensis]|uniref:uncharacterized protein n=1 Tax=Scheffersomyces amazonensis TaxID=1078765 RepID=UPI00315CA4F5
MIVCPTLTVPATRSQLPQICNLPDDLIATIISNLSTKDLKALAQVNIPFRYHSNAVLYRDIVLVDDYSSWNSEEPCTKCHLSSIVALAQALNDASIFQHVRSIKIRSQSKLNVNDYTNLYSSLNSVWNVSDSLYPIQFENYDYPSIEKHHSLNQYIANQAIRFNPYNCSYEAISDNKFSNVIVLSETDIDHYTTYTCLQSMSMLIPNLSSRSNSILNWTNMCQLQHLYLDTHASTEFLLQQFNSNCSQLSLRSLAISHTHSGTSELTMSQISQIIDFSTIEKLELRLGCMHHGCTCIVNFISHLNSAELMPNLESFTLTNLGSDARSASQFKIVINETNFKWQSLRSIYIQFTNLNYSDCTLSMTKFINNIKSIPTLQEITIPDFLATYWTSNRFDRLTTGCECNQCISCKRLFNDLSYYDSTNHFKHDFKSNHYNNMPTTSNLSLSLITKNHNNIRFLQYLVSQLQSQFRSDPHYSLLEQPYCYVTNHYMESFVKLFTHNYLQSVHQQVLQAIPSIQTINLGGIPLK